MISKERYVSRETLKRNAEKVRKYANNISHDEINDPEHLEFISLDSNYNLRGNKKRKHEYLKKKITFDNHRAEGLMDIADQLDMYVSDESLYMTVSEYNLLMDKGRNFIQNEYPEFKKSKTGLFVGVGALALALAFGYAIHKNHTNENPVLGSPSDEKENPEDKEEEETKKQVDYMESSKIIIDESDSVEVKAALIYNEISNLEIDIAAPTPLPENATPVQIYARAEYIWEQIELYVTDFKAQENGKHKVSIDSLEKLLKDKDAGVRELARIIKLENGFEVNDLKRKKNGEFDMEAQQGLYHMDIIDDLRNIQTIPLSRRIDNGSTEYVAPTTRIPEMFLVDYSDGQQLVGKNSAFIEVFYRASENGRDACRPVAKAYAFWMVDTRYEKNNNLPIQNIYNMGQRFKLIKDTNNVFELSGTVDHNATVRYEVWKDGVLEVCEKPIFEIHDYIQGKKKAGAWCNEILPGAWVNDETEARIYMYEFADGGYIEKSKRIDDYDKEAVAKYRAQFKTLSEDEKSKTEEEKLLAEIDQSIDSSNVLVRKR